MTLSNVLFVYPFFIFNLKMDEIAIKLLLSLEFRMIVTFYPISLIEYVYSYSGGSHFGYYDKMNEHTILLICAPTL